MNNPGHSGNGGNTDNIDNTGKGGAALTTDRRGEHPLLTGLRAVREPKGRTLQVVEALCRPRPMPTDADPDWRPHLPSYDEIARELGMSPSRVKTCIGDMARMIDGLEELEASARIWLWYQHSQWERGLNRGKR